MSGLCAWRDLSVRAACTHIICEPFLCIGSTVLHIRGRPYLPKTHIAILSLRSFAASALSVPQPTTPAAHHHPFAAGTASTWTSVQSGRPSMPSQTPPSVSGPQPRPTGPSGPAGIAAHVPALRSGPLSTSTSHSAQPHSVGQVPTHSMPPHGQQHLLSNPAPFHGPGTIHRHAGGGKLSGVRPQGWPGQPTGRMQAGPDMPDQAASRHGSMRPQQRSSMATAQQHQSQRDRNGVPQASAAQNYTGQQAASLAQHSGKTACYVPPNWAALHAAGKEETSQHIPTVQHVQQRLQKDHSKSVLSKTMRQYGPRTLCHGQPEQEMHDSAPTGHLSDRQVPAADSAAGSPDLQRSAGKPAHAASDAPSVDHIVGNLNWIKLSSVSGLGTHLAFKGKLTLSTLQTWVKKDLDAALAHLELTRKVRPPRSDSGFGWRPL